MSVLAGALGLGACGSDDIATTATTTATPAESLEAAAADWAVLFGTNDPGACDYMDATVCDIFIGPQQPTRFESSFASATVDCYELDDDESQATVRFTNDEVVKWFRFGEDEWEVDNMGGNLGKNFECPE